ncbi:MAG: IclR family transcriptional regulator [Betaproteobacteria bacterium]|nr:IclR family transcriptional regulator [Betaproteobacteria bacterium]
MCARRTERETDVPGLERGIAILRLLHRDRERLTAPEIATELGIPRSTVHRLLHSLETLGLLRSEPRGCYALGPGILALGFEYLASLDIVEVANPVLAQLRDETGCSTHLALLDRTSVVFVTRHPVRAAVSSGFGVGFTVPAHAALIGRLMLGDLDRHALALLYKGVKLAPAGPNAPTSLAALAANLAKEGARGYGISDSLSASSLFPRGMVAISAPVRGADGRIAAGINATTVSGAFSAATIRGSLKDRVLTAAGEISVRLGAPPGALRPRTRSATTPKRG